MRVLTYKGSVNVAHAALVAGRLSPCPALLCLPRFRTSSSTRSLPTLAVSDTALLSAVHGVHAVPFTYSLLLLSRAIAHSVSYQLSWRRDAAGSRIR